MPIDYSKYPPNWKSEIVPEILIRAGNKCEICGLKNKQIVWSAELYVKCPESGRYGFRKIWFRDARDARRIRHLCCCDIKPVKVILTVAHLDHDEENHDVRCDRLMAMCQYCHLKYDAKEKMRRICERAGA